MYAALWAFFVVSVLPIALQVLVGLGFGIATFTGMEFLLDELQLAILMRFNNVGADIMQLMYLFGLDTIVEMLFATFTSAYSVRAAMGLNSRTSWSRPTGA